jgi:hypothetical protein
MISGSYENNFGQLINVFMDYCVYFYEKVNSYYVRHYFITPALANSFKIWAVSIPDEKALWEKSFRSYMAQLKTTLDRKLGTITNCMFYMRARIPVHLYKGEQVAMDWSCCLNGQAERISNAKSEGKRRA